MTIQQLVLLGVVASSFLPGCMIFFLNDERKQLRTFLNLFGACLKVILVTVMLWGVSRDEKFEFRYGLVQGVDFVLRADPLSCLFVALSAGLWLLTTIYAIGYLRDSLHQARFFGFFSLCVTASTGLAVAGNLLTFLIFYEMLTLTTFPLVIHRGTHDSLRGGRYYLLFSLSGGSVLLLAIIWLQSLVGPIEFGGQAIASQLQNLDPTKLQLIFAMMVLGFGVKAALVPLHVWLPKAMVAPAPVSALLHAVAVVKAGAFGITRLVLDVFGIEVCHELNVLNGLVLCASVTILYGSLRAMFQDDIKKRLAFSTVSQVSYIALGIGISGYLGTIGGILHLVHQGIMKITLFFAAGNMAETLGVKKTYQMNGLAHRMPWTMTAFTIAGLGMIGMPPTAGFISKWYLGMGAIDAGSAWILGVLVASSLLNAAYFLPLIYAAWFRDPPESWPAESLPSRFEAPLTLLLPPVFTAFLTLLTGLLAGMPFSPLDWATFIVNQEYMP